MFKTFETTILTILMIIMAVGYMMTVEFSPHRVFALIALVILFSIGIYLLGKK